MRRFHSGTVSVRNLDKEMTCQLNRFILYDFEIEHTLEAITLDTRIPNVAIELKLKLSPSPIPEADQRTNERLVYRAMSSVLLSN